MIRERGLPLRQFAMDSNAIHRNPFTGDAAWQPVWPGFDSELGRAPNKSRLPHPHAAGEPAPARYRENPLAANGVHGGLCRGSAESTTMVTDLAILLMFLTEPQPYQTPMFTLTHRMRLTPRFGDRTISLKK